MFIERRRARFECVDGAGFVPTVFIGWRLDPDAHTPLFVLSVLAIVPLAALSSHGDSRLRRA